MLYLENRRLGTYGAGKRRPEEQWSGWLRMRGLPVRYDGKGGLLLAAVLSGVICLFCVQTMPEFLPYLWRTPLLGLLNWLPVLLVLLLAASALDNVCGAAAVTLAVLHTLSVANRLKIDARDDPVSLPDLALLREAVTAAGSYDLQFDWAETWICTAALALLLAGAVLTRPQRQGQNYAARRAAVFTGSLCLLAGLTATVYASPAVFAALPCSNRYHMSTVCRETGFFYTFLRSATQNRLQKPDGFSLSGTMQAVAQTATAPDDPVPVHVLFVMSEAFSDLTDADAFDWQGTDDPLLHFHALQQSEHAISGHLVVPWFGGGTADTEFDVLTGMQTAMLSDTSVSAFRVMHQGLPSVFRTAAQNGWQTAFLHPGKAWFYNRQNAYRWLGARQIVFEQAFTDALFKGGYVSDASLANYIIQDFKRRLEDGAPQMTYVTTIQNHMAYSAEKYAAEDDVQPLSLAEGQTLSAQAEEMLTSYAYGVRDADVMLGRLVYYFERQDEPVLLVWFGDHMPSLGEEYLCYRELGMDMSGDRSDEDWLDAYAPPFLLWANDAAADALEFDTLAERLALPEDGRLSASFLGAAVLDAVGCGQSDAFFAFVNALRRELPVVQRGTVVDAQGEYTAEPDADVQEQIAAYQDRVYYRMKYETVDGTTAE